jgi:hypothetical protein
MTTARSACRLGVDNNLSPESERSWPALITPDCRPKRKIDQTTPITAEVDHKKIMMIHPRFMFSFYSVERL